MSKAKHGDNVKVHYTGKLDNGNVFDTTNNQEPLQIKIGKNEVIPGFEQAIIGMEPGETKTTKISANRAYGTYREELVVEVNKDKIIDDVKPEVGQKLKVSQPDGQKFVVTVKEVSASTVTLDANHPLAGKDLTFEIQLLEII